MERDGSVYIHHQNIRSFAMEMSKVFQGISPQIVKEIFQFRDAVHYQIKKTDIFRLTSNDLVIFDIGSCI